MKAYIKGSDNKIANVRFEEERDMYIDIDKPYIRYLKEDIILIKETNKIYVVKSQRDKMVRQIMHEFDFNKVYEVMKCLNWGYYNTSVPPSMDSLRSTALSCLKEVRYNKERGYASTGGFCASFEEVDGGLLRLTFEVEENELSVNMLK